MMKYIQHFATRKTPQSEKIPGSKQVRNSAGGYSFPVDDWARLDRFLVLGAEGGSYYATERKLTIENAEAVGRCIDADGPRTVATIVRVSDEGRAPKNDPAIFALAMALKLGDEQTRRLAAAAVPKVCRTGTHLYQLAEAVKAFGGWGRITARAFASWFNQQSAERLALQVVKYPQRNGWSAKDLLVKSHAGATAPSTAHRAVYAWVAHDGDLSARTVRRFEKNNPGYERVIEYPEMSRDDLPRIIEGVEKARAATSAKEVVKLIIDYDLPRECIPTEHLRSPEVWDALLRAGQGMPMTAMIRNLGKMSAVGLTRPLSDASRYVVKRLADKDAIRKARLHPLSLLVAQRVYAQGKGQRGRLEWKVVQPIVTALDQAFYAAFHAVEPTGKRWLLALDVSGSMTLGNIAGTPLTPRDASAAMALVTANVEADHHIVAFSSRGWTAGGSRYGWSCGIESVPLTANMSLRDAVRMIEQVPMGGTDCALPMIYAKANDVEVDVFVVYTDSETWAGKVHPTQALREYRDKTGIPAKLIVCGMVSNGFSIADPDDGGMLDVVGFDTAAPNIMASFAMQ